MVAMVTEAWALAGCGAASKAAAQESPVQQHPSAAAKAKRAVPCRGVSSSIRCQERRREAVVVVGRRSGLASCLLAAVAASLYPGAAARAAILEADDDLELLERVKEDRKKRLEKQGVISSSGAETGYLQDLIYKLSQVGQAIDKDDLPAAGSVLGPSPDAQWLQNVNAAFSKFSSSPEEKNVVDSFNSSLASLFTSDFDIYLNFYLSVIYLKRNCVRANMNLIRLTYHLVAVNKLDAESSKSAFVSSATALEKWIALAGLGSKLKGY